MNGQSINTSIGSADAPHAKTNRRAFLRTLSAGVVAVTTVALMVGCGGGSSSGSGATGGSGSGATGNSPFAGTYQGVYSNNSGASSPDVGTLSLTISPSGAISVTTVDSAGGSSDTFTGTISNNGTIQAADTGAPLSTVQGTLTQNASSHSLSGAVTVSGGGSSTQSVVTAGLTPTSSALAGSYSGTETTSGGYTGNMTLTVSATGAVTGQVIVTGSSSGTVPLSGYVDSSGALYLAYISGGTYATLTGSPTLTGNSFAATLQERDSNQGGQAGATVTLTLTKQ